MGVGVNGNLIPPKKGEVRNPGGKPKGTLHLSTHIQNALNDPDFEVKLKDGSLLKTMPVKAIINTAIAKSIDGDTRAMEWLAKHGYGEKIKFELDNPVSEILKKFGMSGGADDRKDDELVQAPSQSDPQS